MDGPPPAAARAGHEDDFHAWALEQVALLRAGRLSEADLENIAQEMEDLAKRVERRIRNRLKVLLAHLLKWDVQPELRSRSWRSTILVQREAISDLLDGNPSLAARWDEHLVHAYDRAIRAASAETGLPGERFRLVTPWTREQILSDDFLPGEAGQPEV